MRSPLWGDRDRWGLTINERDPSWIEYQDELTRFYDETQRGVLGRWISDAGYRVMSRIDLSGKRVLEIGPGDIRHMAFWNGKPNEYLLVDIQKRMLLKAQARLAEIGVPCQPLLVGIGKPLPFEDASLDVVVSFFSLEHIYPLAPYLREVQRVLRPGGNLIGAIPAEGGLAWGGGRMLTTRRWFRRHTSVDPDKIICWEHPNFGDQILAELDESFDRQLVRFWPLPWLPLLDVNLTVRFHYRNRV